MKKNSFHKLSYRFSNQVFFLISTLLFCLNNSTITYAMTDEAEKGIQIVVKEKDIKKENSKYKKEKWFLLKILANLKVKFVLFL